MDNSRGSGLDGILKLFFAFLEALIEFVLCRPSRPSRPQLKHG